MSKWETVKLGDVSTVNPSKKQPQVSYEDKLVSFIPMSEVTEDGGINTNIEKLYSEVSSGFTYFIEDDVLFAKITPCMENGKGAIARGLINGLGVGSTEFHVLRPNKDFVTSDWVFRFISFSKFRKLAEKNMTGSAGQKRVPKAFLENVLIPLPLLETQKQIAKTLDTAAEILGMRKQQLAELDKLIKSTFYDIFGVYTLDKNCYELLPNICNFIDYRGKTPEKSDSGIPLITAKNVKNNAFSIEPKEYIPADTYDAVMTRGFPKINDVIFTTEAPLGNVCRIPDLFGKFAVGQRIIVMQPFENMVTSEYLEFALTSDEFQRDMFKRSSGSTVIGIRSKELVQLTIPIPPLTLQTKFTEIVTKIEEQKALVKKAIDETQCLFDSLMSEYFE